MTFPVLENWTWPWSDLTLHVAYLVSGLLIAVQYIPQLQRAWCFPLATLVAQSLSTWTVWTLCRAVAFIYGIFVLHDLVLLVVVGADMFGRLAMMGLIIRAHVIAARITLMEASLPNPNANPPLQAMETNAAGMATRRNPQPMRTDIPIAREA
jgi:hypothetical protein